jgi:RNA polymerase sigma factor (sigma-70 family)
MNGTQVDALIRSVVYKIYKMYPDVEWDDLESQAWLIVTEKIDRWDPEIASLSTFLYPVIHGYLQMYVQRYVLKELNMNGHRSHVDYAEESHGYSEEGRLDAKMQLDRMLEESSGVSRDILKLMLQGYNQSEVAEQLGFSKQYIGQVLRDLRAKYKEI